MSFNKFCTDPPRHQNALDLFEGHWASQLPRDVENLLAGNARHFDADPRPLYAAQHFGGPLKSIRGFDVLELGPLEGGHSYQLEQLGANVTAIEGNAEAYLKCLIAKEILHLKTRFFLGNFLPYLQNETKQFDMIFASGVLYHMVNPLQLIELICQRSSRCFLWTHYVNEATAKDFHSTSIKYGGIRASHFQRDYGNRDQGNFWGGLADTSSWLRHSDIERAFKHFGHRNFKIIEDEKNHPNGPSFSAVTWA